MRVLQFIIVFLVFTACKSNKALVVNGDIKSMSTARIVKKHNANNFPKNTIKARLKIKLKTEKEDAGATAKLRLEKDKHIWISVTKTGIPFVKIYITPNSVKFYNKLSKEFFDGDFSLLNQWLGTDFDFEKVQNLLLGKAIFTLDKKELNSKIEGKSYKLTPKQQNALFMIDYFVNPAHFFMNKEEISKPNSDETLSLSYNTYQKIEDVVFPKEITVITTKNGKTTKVEAEYKSVDFNKSVKFPFTIPKEYKEIIIE